MTSFLLLSFLFLIAGVIAVPIASRLGLGSVLGYLIAGIAISPVLVTLEVDVIAIQHFAEFGVVMMLFLVGLELEPKMLWAMRNRLFGLGGLQILLTIGAVMGVAMLMGQTWTVSLVVGMVLALSSTAIVLQTLNEKKVLKSDGGQSSFSVLLFQDIAVIPMLAIIPLLALPDILATQVHTQETHGTSVNLLEGLNGWQVAVATLLAVSAVVGCGYYLVRPVFNFIAITRLRELFVATALLFVIGIALLMMAVGLSPALGTFIAGVVLANSEYRHELESDIDPFRGLLLGLFFMTVGASINFALLWENLPLVLGMTFGLIALKTGVLLLLTRWFGIIGADRWLFALGLAQAGEFGFVLLSFSVTHAALPADISELLLLVVALSMLLTPLLFIINDKVFFVRFARKQHREADEMDAQGDIIIAGHGRFGGIVNLMLLTAGYSTTVVDYSSEQLTMLRSFGIRVFYGDATRPDLLHAAGINRAKMLIVAIDNRDQITAIVRHVVEHHPHVYVIARAIDRPHVYELYSAGCRDVIRDTFDSAVRTGRSAFEAMGVHRFEAERFAQKFVRSDQQNMRDMASLFDPTIPLHENEAYREKAKEIRARMGEQLQGKEKILRSHIEREWLPPDIRTTQSEHINDA